MAQLLEVYFYNKLHLDNLTSQHMQRYGQSMLCAKAGLLVKGSLVLIFHSGRSVDHVETEKSSGNNVTMIFSAIEISTPERS